MTLCSCPNPEYETTNSRNSIEKRYMNWGLDKDMTLKSARLSIKLDIRERLGGFIYNYLNTPTGELIIVDSRGDHR